MTDENGLTDVARELADIIGIGPTLLLCEHFGGEKVRVPMAVGEVGTRIERIIGREACMKLVRVYAGDSINVPKLAAREKRLRNDMIYNEWLHGATQRELANRHGLTSRQVRSILSEHHKAYREHEHAAA